MLICMLYNKNAAIIKLFHNYYYYYWWVIITGTMSSVRKPIKYYVHAAQQTILENCLCKRGDTLHYLADTLEKKCVI